MYTSLILRLSLSCVFCAMTFAPVRHLKVLGCKGRRINVRTRSREPGDYMLYMYTHAVQYRDILAVVFKAIHYVLSLRLGSLQ